jgi:hypothetical protein
MHATLGHDRRSEQLDRIDGAVLQVQPAVMLAIEEGPRERSVLS